MDYIVVDRYSKIIKNRTVLDSVSMSVGRGECVGVVGSNGSGKTMLLRAICGLIMPTNGCVTIDGKRVGKDISFPPRVGVIIENVGLWPQYSGRDNLMRLAAIRKQISETDVDAAIRRVALEPTDKRIYSKYSLGMKQRLALAQAIMERPDLLLLDEPTNALDENGVDLVRSIIREENERGVTVFIASHNRDDISLLCDRTFRMQAGRLRAEGGDNP